MIIESIPLTIISTGLNTFVAEVQIEVDGHYKPFLLDTGAASSSVINDEQTKNYSCLEQTESIGVSGISTAAQVIQMQTLSVGKYTFKKSRIIRTDRSVLGIDLIGEHTFEVDLKNKQLNFLSELPCVKPSYAIRRLATGHFTLSMKLGNKNVDVLFDTGADTTIVDLQYIKQNSELFQLVRSEDGYDHHGNKIPSEIYKVAEVEVGTLELQNVEIATFDFGVYLRQKMEGVPIILGNNIIGGAAWAFDLKLCRWNLKPY